MILGKHTVSETREFAKLIDFRVAAEDKLLESKKPLPQDDATLAAIAKYTAWRTNWQKVRDGVIQALDLVSFAPGTILASETVIPSETQYQKLRCAVNKSCDDSFTDPGDMHNVMSALEKVLNQPADLSGFRAAFPASADSFDPDLGVFKTADTGIKTGEGAAKDLGASMSKAGAAMPWWVYVGGGAAVLGVGYLYVGPFLPRWRR